MIEAKDKKTLKEGGTFRVASAITSSEIALMSEHEKGLRMEMIHAKNLVMIDRSIDKKCTNCQYKHIKTHTINNIARHEIRVEANAHCDFKSVWCAKDAEEIGIKNWREAWIEPYGGLESEYMRVAPDLSRPPIKNKGESRRKANKNYGTW